MKLKIFFATAIALIAATTANGASAGDAYPAKPVVIIAPSGPGGGYDFVGRLMGQALTDKLKGSFVVENRAGSGTLVGTKAAASAAPDGYTLMVGGLSNLAFNSALYPKLSYNPQTDFTPVKLVARYPYLLVARADLKLDTVREITALAKLQPETFTVATVGSGSGQQVLAAAFAKSANVKFLFVPYKSAQAVYMDLLAGRVDLFFDTLPSVKPHLDSKRAKAIFITSPARNAAVPTVATAREAGLPNLEMGSWFGLFAPRKTPSSVIADLRAALDSTMKEPAMVSRMTAAGIEVMSYTPQQTDAFLKSEFDKWTGVIKQAGITAE